MRSNVQTFEAKGGIVRCRKTVTPNKLEANRLNAKNSTGPRTDCGKRNSRFNALTLGLFAKHIAIPICDGYKPEKDFQLLLDGLHARPRFTRPDDDMDRILRYERENAPTAAISDDRPYRDLVADSVICVTSIRVD